MRLGWLYYYTMIYYVIFVSTIEISRRNRMRCRQCRPWLCPWDKPRAEAAYSGYLWSADTFGYLWSEGWKVKMRETLRDSQPQDPIRTASACWDCSLRITSHHFAFRFFTSLHLRCCLGIFMISLCICALSCFVIYWIYCLLFMILTSWLPFLKDSL